MTKGVLGINTHIHIYTYMYLILEQCGLSTVWVHLFMDFFHFICICIYTHTHTHTHTHYGTKWSVIGLIHGYKARDIKEPIYGGPTIKLGFPGGSVGKESTFQCRRWRFSPWVGKIPGEGMATHSSILAWEFHGQRSLKGYSPWGHKELDRTEHTHMQ